MATKEPKLTKALKKILQEIADNTANGEKTYVDNRAVPLDEMGYITVDVNDTDDCDDVAAMATESGMAICGYQKTDETTSKIEKEGETVVEETKTEETKQTEFELDFGIPMPPKGHGGGKRAMKYPFEELPAPNEDGAMASFHIAPIEGSVEKAMRRASSSCTNAKKRFGDERVFEIRKADENDPKGPGARVFRTK